MLCPIHIHQCWEEGAGGRKAGPNQEMCMILDIRIAWIYVGDAFVSLLSFG